jgi:hypothetical protein
MKTIKKSNLTITTNDDSIQVWDNMTPMPDSTEPEKWRNIQKEDGTDIFIYIEEE